MKAKSLVLSCVLVGIILSSVVFLSGCLNGPPLPDGVVSITICSGSSRVYGDVYINRNQIAGKYLRANGCVSDINVDVGREILIEIKDDWGDTFFTYFTPSTWNTRVTIHP